MKRHIQGENTILRPHAARQHSMRNTVIVVAMLAFGAIVAWAMPALPGTRGIAGYLPLHMLIEISAIVVSMLVFAAGWNAYSYRLPGNMVLLACAFFGVGLLDFAHMLSYVGMPDFVTPSGTEKAINFWLAARLLAAGTLLAAAVMPLRPFASAMPRYLLLAAAVAVAALAHWLFLFHPGAMPRTFIPGEGLTAFKVASEYAIVTLNLAAAFVLWRSRHMPQPFNVAALFGAASTMALSGFFFTIYAEVTDVFNLLGHVYKVIAYLFLYRAIFVEAVETPYSRLSASQDQLRATIDAIPDLLFELGADGRCHDCHTSRLDLLPLPIESMLDKTVADMLPLAAADVIMSALQEAQEKGRSQGKVFELPLAQDVHWFELSVSRKSGETDQEPHFIVLLRDITGRKQTEEALRRSEMGLGIARSIGKIGSWTFNAHTGRVECSMEICRLFGIPQQSVIDPKIFSPGVFVKSIHPDDFDLVIGAWGEAMLGAEYDIEHRIVIGGNTRWIRNCARVERDPEGRIIAAMGMMQDITASKNTQLEIARLNQVYQLLSRVNEAIVRSRERNELFVAICKAAIESELFRFAWIGMLDETWVIPVAHAGVEDGYLLSKFDILLDDERTGNGPIGRAIRQNTHVICQNIEHDPSMAPWRGEAIKRGYRASAAFPICEAGAVAGAMNVYAAETQFFTPDIVKLMLELAADISFSLDTFASKVRQERAETELKQLNLELEQRVMERTRQLEAANKELEAFSYSVSHDLRAPLRSIDGFSQILLKTYHDQLDETGKDYLQRVRRASQRMGRLIDDLLQLSQVARGSLRRQPVDLSEMAGNVVDDLRKTNPERRIRFILHPGLSVQADPGLLRIVLDNLMDNSCKYTGKKAEAEIEFGRCDINGREAFFVRDNGDGFNMDYAHKLFGTFQRLHSASEFEGTGIGLATVQRIIHRHNGRVWAEGREGQGATFYFTLPQRERHEEPT